MMQEYVEDQNLISDGVTGKLQSMGIGTADIADSYPHLQDANLRVFVIFQPTAETDFVSTSLEVMDQKGALVGSGSVLLGRGASTTETRSEMQAATVAANKSTLDASAALKEILARADFGQRETAAAGLQLEPDLRAALLTPTTHDPLSFALSECVLKIAQAEGANAIFVGTDECEQYARESCRNGKIGKDLFFHMMASGGEMDVQLADRWLIGKPLSPLQAEQNRFPRGAIEAYLQAKERQGFLSIEDQCALAMNATPTMRTDLARLAKQSIWGTEDSNLLYDTESVYQLYGSLDDADRQAARSEVTIPMGKLSPDQLDIVNRFLFSGYNNFQLASGLKSGRLTPGEYKHSKTWGMRSSAAPNGLQPSDEVVVTDSVNDVVFANQSLWRICVPSQPKAGRDGDECCGNPAARPLYLHKEHELEQFAAWLIAPGEDHRDCGSKVCDAKRD